MSCWEVQSVMKKKVYIKTIGCQMNKHDSDRMYEILLLHGYEPTTNEEEAQLLILNTCSIREKAENKALSALGRWRKYKEQKGAIIVLAGCVAQQYGRLLLDKAPYLDVVMGPDQIYRIGELVLEAKKGKKITATQFTTEEDPKFLFNRPEVLPPSPSAYVTIMKGCDEHCTFCIVPKVRGKVRTRKVTEIINEIKLLVENGVKEVILLGQIVNAYKWGELDFVNLLYEIAKIEGLERIRYTSPHPRYFTESLIRAHGEIEKLCEYIHLPVQSGSNKILKRMGRRHTREEFLDIVYKLKETVKGVALGTDIIVGFPGESEEDFMDTVSLLKEVEFDNIFSFKYSPRPMTAALKMGDDIPMEEKERRLEVIHQVQQQIQQKKMEQYLNTFQEVLVEGESRVGGGQLTGRTRTNYIVNFYVKKEEQKDFDINSLVSQLIHVKITKIGSHTFEGIYEV